MRLYVPFVIAPVEIPTIDADVIVGVAVDVHIIK